MSASDFTEAVERLKAMTAFWSSPDASCEPPREYDPGQGEACAFLNDLCLVLAQSASPSTCGMSAANEPKTLRAKDSSPPDHILRGGETRPPNDGEPG